jgi:hypothetical protein
MNRKRLPKLIRGYGPDVRMSLFWTLSSSFGRDYTTTIHKLSAFPPSDNKQGGK